LEDEGCVEGLCDVSLLAMIKLVPAADSVKVVFAYAVIHATEVNCVRDIDAGGTTLPVDT
jgi:hypothetical protein